MKNKLLLPRKCRTIGWILFLIALLNLVARYYWDFQMPLLCKHVLTKQGTVTTDTLFYDYTEQAAWIFIIISLFMMAFSKQKIEDEYVQSIRLNALLISIYAYIIVLLFITLFSINTFLLFAVINVMPLILIFILVFNYQLFIKSNISKTGTA